MDITANEFFKNIINLYMGQPLQLYTSNKAAWNDLKQQRTDNVGKYINKVQKFIRLFQFTLDPLTFTDISSKLFTTLLMPQLWMYAGTEAVKMATEDRFDITEWFKLIKDREVACKSNDEMTETKSTYQLQQIQTSRYRPPSRTAPAMNQAPYCTYHKNSSHWTSECPVAAYGRRPAQSNYQMRRSSQTPNNTWRRDSSTYNNPVQRDIRPPRPAFDRRSSSPRSDTSSTSKLRSALRTPRPTTPSPAPVTQKEELNFMLNDFEDNLFINEKNLPRSINVIVKEFEDSDVVQPETEFEKSTTSKEEPSIKSVKSFNNECVGSIIRLSINLDNKFFDRSSAMASCNVNTCVPELFEFSSEEVALMPEVMEMVERDPSDQLHGGSEMNCDQNLLKRARIDSVQFSSSPTLRRSARLLQKATDTEILRAEAQKGSVREVPALISVQETVPVLRLRGGGPRRVHRRPTIQRPSRPANTDRTVPSPVFWTPIHPVLMGLDHPGAIGTPAWSQEGGYDSFSWERMQHPFSDWLTIQDRDLLTGEMPRHFPGSIRFNQVLRQLNRDIGFHHLEGPLLGYSDEEDRTATRMVPLDGRNVRESSLLDQVVFYSELGLRTDRGSIDDVVLLRCRVLLTRKAPLHIQRVDELVTQSRHQESIGHVVERSLLRMIDPMSVPVSFMVWTYVQMCADLQCSPHMRGATHDIFKWWIMEALQFTPRYNIAVQAYYRMLMSSAMVQSDSGSYQVRDVIHVRDLLVFTAHMYSHDQIEEDYMWSMDWSRAWSPDDLTVMPSYIFNAYTRNSSSVPLNHLNARNIMRWWNLQRALRVGPFEYAMTILVGELREWRLHQDVLLNPPFSRDSSNTSYIDEDPGSAK